MKIIHLISSPRNISTALMYSFAQRDDTVVMDEPFYAVYLKKSGAVHPGREDVLKALPAQEQDVRNQINQHSRSPVLFIKNMAHHLEVLENFPLMECNNIFLIRNPKQILASYAQVIEKPGMRDIGIQFQYAVFKLLLDAGIEPIVLDSGLLLENPESVLGQVCEKTGVPFDKKMLSWQAGPKPYDGVWAPHWYANVHASTGFQKQPTSERPLPKYLNTLYKEALFFYEKLLPFALRPL